MTDRPPSWKDRLHRAPNPSFMGCAAQLQAFRSTVATPWVDRPTLLFNIAGPSGVGKTTLLKQFRKITEELKQVAAYVDEGAGSPAIDPVPAALHRLALDLAQQGYEFKAFQQYYQIYRQQPERGADPEAAAAVWAEMAPVMGPVIGPASLAEVSQPSEGRLDGLEANGLGHQAEGWAGGHPLTPSAEALWAQGPLAVLTTLFLADLNQIAAEKTVVLLLDTDEHRGGFWPDWLQAVLDDRFTESLHPNCLLVIVGREQLDPAVWGVWEEVIDRSELAPLSRATAEAVLASQGIVEAAVVEEIWQLSSGGLPVLLGMMAQNAPATMVTGNDPCVSAAERFLQWEPDEAQRQIALQAALPRQLNQDVLAVLADTQAGAREIAWLKSRSFVGEHPEGWQYHGIVRAQMLCYQRRLSLSTWERQQGQLAAYYDECRQKLGLEAQAQWQDERWQRYTLEWLYHSLCAAPQKQLGMALNGWLTGLMQSPTVARAWAAVMTAAGEVTTCGELKRCGERLREGLTGAADKCYDEGIAALSELLKDSRIAATYQAVATDRQGYWHHQSEPENVTPSAVQATAELDGEYARYWENVAWSYQDRKRYEEAIMAYYHAIDLNPKTASPHNGLGNVYREQKRYDEAIAAYQQAIDLDPQLGAPYNGLGHLYREQKRYGEAIVAYQRAIHLDPQLAMAHNGLGHVYRDQKRYGDAIVAYQRAIHLDPKLAAPHNGLGGVYAEQKCYGTAIAAYQQAIHLDPKTASPHNGLGHLYRDQKRYDEAIAAYQRALHLDPQLASSYNGLGIVYKEQKRYKKAITAYHRAIDLDPQYAYSHTNLGNLYRDQKRYDEAIVAYHRAIDLDPQLAAPHNGLGIVYKEQKRYDEAIAAYQRAIAIDPQFKYAIANLGTAYRILGHYEEAIQCCDRALAIDANYRWAVYQRGYAYLLMQQCDRTIQDFDQAITIAPTKDWYCYCRAIAHLALNHPEAAHTDITRAIDLAQTKYAKDPTDWKNTFNLALYHLVANHFDSAYGLYQNALGAASCDRIQIAQRDLQDFLILFPDHVPAQRLVALLGSSRSTDQ